MMNKVIVKVKICWHSICDYYLKFPIRYDLKLQTTKENDTFF